MRTRAWILPSFGRECYTTRGDNGNTVGMWPGSYPCLCQKAAIWEANIEASGGKSTIMGAKVLHSESGKCADIG